MLAEGSVRSEPRLTVLKICLEFIANSLFSATLIGSCRTRATLRAFSEDKAGEEGGRHEPSLRLTVNQGQPSGTERY